LFVQFCFIEISDKSGEIKPPREIFTRRFFILSAGLDLLKCVKKHRVFTCFSVFFLIFSVFFGAFPAGIKNALIAWNGCFWLNLTCAGCEIISSFFQFFS
jgi:hypothetical protein